MRKLIWVGRPSQLINIFVYLFLFWTIIIPLYSYLKTRFTIFELSKDRLKLKKGILSQQIDETELYRIRDYEVSKPFILRIFGLGNLKKDSVIDIWTSASSMLARKKLNNAER